MSELREQELPFTYVEFDSSDAMSDVLGAQKYRVLLMTLTNLLHGGVNMYLLILAISEPLPLVLLLLKNLLNIKDIYETI